MAAENTSPFVSIKVNGDILKFNAIDIICFEANDKYIKLTTLDKCYLARCTMNELDIQLNQKYFCRVHRSYIVGLHHVKKVLKDHLLTSSLSMPVDNKYRENLLIQLNFLD